MNLQLQHKTVMKNFALFLLQGCLIIGFFFLGTGKVFSQSVPDGTSPYVTGITAGRATSIVGGVIALISLILGWRAKASSSSSNLSGVGAKGNRRTQAIIALSLGGIAIILSVIHLSTSAGAVFGSGSGKAGAIVSLVLALTGAALSGLALRPKRA
ncbi:DUF6223 family protein [Paraflavitalea speifideaquila]|uniref:DUF6223 family protein n=1 Tax=Paraflavitalea speifideaquila TaxID=3076558 RepID=UPI0028F01D04|nr:DUF6223 family protein [Paraflavitalea speifideiaquila]